MQPAPLDPDGYLLDHTQWTPDIAQHLALAENVRLTDAHWAMIELARRYHARFHHAPAMRPLVNWVRQELGPEFGNSRYLHQLFPQSPAKQLARLAGLPKPKNCL